MTAFQLIAVFCMAFCCLSFFVFWVFVIILIAKNASYNNEIEEITKKLEGKK